MVMLTYEEMRDAVRRVLVLSQFDFQDLLQSQLCAHCSVTVIASLDSCCQRTRPDPHHDAS